jgi:hypothetical protein
MASCFEHSRAHSSAADREAGLFVPLSRLEPAAALPNHPVAIGAENCAAFIDLGACDLDAAVKLLDAAPLAMRDVGAASELITNGLSPFARHRILVDVLQELGFDANLLLGFGSPVTDRAGQSLDGSRPDNRACQVALHAVAIGEKAYALRTPGDLSIRSAGPLLMRVRADVGRVRELLRRTCEISAGPGLSPSDVDRLLAQSLATEQALWRSSSAITHKTGDEE